MTVWIVKISMVENVEDLRPELEILVFGYRNFLVDREVPLVKPRTAADAALRADIEVTELGILKVVGVEPKTATGLWVQFLKWRHLLRRFGAKKEDAGNQFVVVFGIQTNGKTALKLGNTGDGPVIQNLPSKTFVLRYRQLPVVAD